MDYPGSKITLPVRRALLITFIALFLIISPLLILYTAGYRYDWTNGILKETGTLSVDVYPRNAKVYLDNEVLNAKIPIRLQNIKPKKYKVKITAPGYFDWEKEIEVKNKQTEYIKEIYLIQKNSPTLIAQGPINQIFISPDKNYLVYSEGTADSWQIWLRDLKNQKNFSLTTLSAPAITVNWSKTNNYFAISEEKPPYNTLYLIDAQQPEKLVNLADELKYPVNKYQWAETTEPEIYISTKLKLLSYFPNSNREFTLSKNDFADWRMENKQLWVARWDKQNSKLTFIKDTLGFSSIFKTLTRDEIFDASNSYDGSLEILSAKNDEILLKKIGTSDMTLVLKDKNFNISGDKFLISDYNNWLLIWTPWELTTYSSGEDPNLLYRSGEKLQQVIPLDRYNTLGLVWADKTTVLFPYYYVSHELFKYSISSAVADSENKILYFSASVSGSTGLWSLRY